MENNRSGGKMKKNMMNMVLTGLLAAMVFCVTYFLSFRIVGDGYIHLGDAVLYMAAVLLPTPYAMASAAVGAGLADLLGGYPQWIPFTVIIKAVMVLAFTAKKERMLCTRNAIAPVIAGVIGILGYFLAEAYLGWMAGSAFFVSAGVALAAVPFNALQELAGGVAFILLAAALDRLQFKRWLTRL